MKKTTSLLHYLIILFLKYTKKNTLTKKQTVCPGWQIQKDTIKSISLLTKTIFLIHIVLFLIKDLCNYYSTQDRLSSVRYRRTLNSKIQNNTSTFSLLKSSTALLSPCCCSAQFPSKWFLLLHSDIQAGLVLQGTELGNWSNLLPFNYMCASIQFICSHMPAWSDNTSTWVLQPVT